MSRLPLEGVRILDLGAMWAGPYAGGLVADLGAEVIKVEAGRRPDPLRFRPLYPNNDPGPRPWNRSGAINDRHRNKLGITLDLTLPRGQALLHQLVKVSDVVLENYSNAARERLHLQYPTLSQVNPQLVLVSLTSQGLSGPEADYVSFGPNLADLAGINLMNGYPDRPRGSYAVTADASPDPLSGILGAAVVVLGLLWRRQTGRGMHLDLSQRQLAAMVVADSIMDFVMNGREDGPWGNSHPFHAPHGCYRCDGEDSWVSIAVTTNEEWMALCRVMGDPPWTMEERFSTPLQRWYHRQELDQLIEEWTRTQDHYEVMNRLQAEGVAAGAVLTAEEFCHDPHIRDRAYLETVTHPEAGTHEYRGRPFQLSRTPLVSRRPAPCLGEHNAYVYRELLGLGEADFQTLEAEGIIGTKPTGSMVFY